MKIFLPVVALLLELAHCYVPYAPANVYVPANVFVPLNPHQIGWNNSYTNSSRNQSWTGPGHLFWGNVGPLDKLLFSKVYFQDSSWWTSRSKIIEYPNEVKSGYLRHETISAVHIINNYYQGNHANASILSGGVGKQYVKIQLASKWRYGFSFLVQIFGH